MGSQIHPLDHTIDSEIFNLIETLIDFDHSLKHPFQDEVFYSELYLYLYRGLIADLSHKLAEEVVVNNITTPVTVSLPRKLEHDHHFRKHHSFSHNTDIT